MTKPERKEMKESKLNRKKEKFCLKKVGTQTGSKNARIRKLSFGRYLCNVIVIYNLSFITLYFRAIYLEILTLFGELPLLFFFLLLYKKNASYDP